MAETTFAHYSKKPISGLCLRGNELNPKFWGIFFASFESFERFVGHVSHSRCAALVGKQLFN